jgi:polysaccharide biosynthesis protein PslH
VTTATSNRLKVLVIADEVPLPPNAGKRIRTWNLLSRLAKRHDISYLCFGRSDNPELKQFESAGIHVELVEPLGERRGASLYASLLVNLLSPYPYSVSKQHVKRFERRLKQLIAEGGFDLVHCEGTLPARYLESLTGIPRVVGTHNIESQIWFRRAQHSRTWFSRLFFTNQANKMKRFERRLLAKMERTTGVTQHDVQQLRDWGARAADLVPNGADIKTYQPAFDEGRSSELLFLASLDWFPNSDALRYFVSEIFPLITGLRPDVMLRIVGRRPPESLKKFAARNLRVELVGEVVDVRPYLERAGVVVVPLRIGGGSRLKILEALAVAKAVVSTSVGAEGLDLVSGEHFTIADAPSEFAKRTVELMQSVEERHRFGHNGREAVSRQYDWDQIIENLDSTWRGTARQTKAASPAPQTKINEPIAR